MRSRRFLALAVFASALAGPVVAQQDGPPPPVEKPEFGTAGTSSVRLTAYDFSGFESVPYASTSGSSIGRYPTSPMSFAAGVHVPGGTNITRIELDYCDNNASGFHVLMNLWQCDNQGQNCVAVSNVLTSSSNGCAFVAQSGLAVHVDNYHDMYRLAVDFGAFDGTNVLTGAIVSYQLQVSPAPGAASFLDVPTSDPAFQYIEALFASGITAGCSGGNYCPDAPLTRRQMAVFLSKALGLYWNLQ